MRQQGYSKEKNRKVPGAQASSRVLEWIENHIRTENLTPGGKLPPEFVIASATKASRSSVREALTVLKVLGIIHSRRKGGITIIREPIMLELRHFFAEHFQSRKIYDDVMEFRLALEWGFGYIFTARITRRDLKALRAVLAGVDVPSSTVSDINKAEVLFHTILTGCSGNRLATLFSYLYTPIFLKNDFNLGEVPMPRDEKEKWMGSHLGMVKALEEKDGKEFLQLLREHAHRGIDLPAQYKKPTYANDIE